MNIVKRALAEIKYTTAVAVGLTTAAVLLMHHTSEQHKRYVEWSWKNAPVLKAEPGPTKIPAEAVIAKLDQKELHCAAVVVWTEARGESIKGQRAVLAVMENRIADKSGRWPNTYCGNAMDPNQFEGITKYGLKIKKKDQPSFQRTKALVADWMAFGYRNPVGKADHYHASWMTSFPKWSSAMDKVADLGKHIFYED